MIKRYFYTIILLILFVNCSNNPSKPIVLEEEILPFLNEIVLTERSGVKELDEDIFFWKNRLTENEANIYKMKLAGLYQQKFGVTKNVELLRDAEILLMESNQFYKENNADVLQALAQLSITKHDFQTAIKYAEKALDLGEDKLLSYMILFDANMETGDFGYAKYILDNEITNTSSFNYLIRKSQYEDYQGNAQLSISALEQGADRVNYNSALSAWAQSNLGDRLGHEGNISKSYCLFLEALNQEQSGASYLHSLKGIAYIAYAHDRNLELAKEIIKFISRYLDSPDTKLFLAEIAEYEGDLEKKRRLYKEFYQEASNPKYYGMYDAELILIATTEFNNYEMAKALVQKELVNRPSPITYDLQAWVLFHEGDVITAKSIIEEKVLGKTYEPIPAYHAGIILNKVGDTKKGKRFLEMAKESEFELGPVTINEIHAELN